MEQYPERLNSIFQALADPTRRAVLGRLSRGPASISELAKPFDNILDDGFGYYLTTHPDALSDTAIALFRSWLIERFGTASGAASAIHLAVSNE